MVQVDINLDGVLDKMSDGNVKRGRQAAANQALADMNQFVPMDEGTLRLTATVDIDGSHVNYNVPYANRLFKYYMHNYTTPGTGPRWDNKAKGIYMNDWKRAFLKGAGW